MYLSILQCTNYCCDTTITHAQLFLRRDKSIIYFELDQSQRYSVFFGCCGLLYTNNLLFCRFPLFVRFRYTCADLWQHLTLSILETSKRSQIPMTNACPNFSFRGLRIKKNFVTTSVTPRKYTLVSSGNGQSITRTCARFCYGRSRPGLRPDPGCARYYEYF